jgi:hypothetical protein
VGGKAQAQGAGLYGDLPGKEGYFRLAIFLAYTSCFNVLHQLTKFHYEDMSLPIAILTERK